MHNFTWTPRGVNVDPSDPSKPTLLEVLLRSPSPTHCATNINAPLVGPEYVYAAVIANVVTVPNLEVPLSGVYPVWSKYSNAHRVSSLHLSNGKPHEYFDLTG